MIFRDRSIGVWCDHYELEIPCTENFVLSYSTQRELFTEARHAGWSITRTSNKWTTLCPAHKENEK